MKIIRRINGTLYYYQRNQSAEERWTTRQHYALRTTRGDAEAMLRQLLARNPARQLWIEGDSEPVGPAVRYNPAHGVPQPSGPEHRR